MSEETRPALVIDGMSILRTIAGPAVQLTNGYAYNFLVQVTAVVKKFKPKGIFICWEGGYAKRLEVHPEYKADRTRTPEGIRAYRDIVKDLMRHLGADQLVSPGYEADDTGALLANTLESAVLFSHDKDWLQLVKPGIGVYRKIKKQGLKSEKALVTHENFHEKTGFISPQDYLRFHIAMGDKVDGIPGMDGIGEKTIVSYLYGLRVSEAAKERLDDFYNNSPEYIRNKNLIDLTGIRDLPVEVDSGKFDERAALDLLTELKFNSIVKQFPEWILNYKGTII